MTYGNGGGVGAVNDVGVHFADHLCDSFDHHHKKSMAHTQVVSIFAIYCIIYRANME